MPVIFHFSGQGFKQKFRNYILVCLPDITVEQDALGEILVNLATEIVIVHLMRRIVLGTMKTIQINVHRIQKRISQQAIMAPIHKVIKLQG